jgi:hypothetical protein
MKWSVPYLLCFSDQENKGRLKGDLLAQGASKSVGEWLMGMARLTTQFIFTIIG